MGLGTMTRGEKAVIYVSSIYLSNSSLIPMVDDVNEIEFEVEMIHFIQVLFKMQHIIDKPFCVSREPIRMGGEELT